MPCYQMAHRHRPRISRAAFLLAVLSLLTILQLVGPGAGTASAQVNPSPPTSSFVYLQISGANPTTTQYSYIGTFWVQYRYDSNSLDRWFRLAPKWVHDAGINKVTFDFVVTTRGKQVNNYRTHEERASYFFHSSIEKFQFFGDAPWTSHRLHPGDTVDISAEYWYMVQATPAPGIHTSSGLHDFWAHYRVGVR